VNAAEVTPAASSAYTVRRTVTARVMGALLRLGLFRPLLMNSLQTGVLLPM
jgi:hypothetical protein